MDEREQSATEDLDTAQRHIVESFQEFEEGFRKRQPVIWFFTLVGPFAVTVFAVVVVFLLAGANFGQRLVVTGTVTFFFAGRFVIVGGELADVMTREQLFLMVTYMDMAVASLLIFHIGVIFRVPMVGPKIAALVADGQFILSRNAWMKRLTFIGLVLFVTFPLAATGSIGGCIFGRLLGMSRLRTLIGVLVGSLLGNSVMYVGADFLAAHKDNPTIKIGGIALIVLIIVLLERRYRAMKKQFVQEN